jgi:Holliday junction resolvase RusA-like endonuclease
MFTPLPLRRYEESIKAEARIAWRAFASKHLMSRTDKISGPVRMMMTFTIKTPATWPNAKRAAALAGNLLPTGRPDLLNLGKAIEDALQGVCYEDDKLVVESSLQKVYGERGSVAIELWWGWD